jgi:hypothetical protein
MRRLLAEALREEEAAEGALKHKKAAYSELQKTCWHYPERIQAAEQAIKEQRQALAIAIADAAASKARPPSVERVRAREQEAADIRDQHEETKIARDATGRAVEELEREARLSIVKTETVITAILVPLKEAWNTKMRGAIEEIRGGLELLAAGYDQTTDRPTDHQGILDYDTARACESGVHEDIIATLRDWKTINATRPNPWLRWRNELRDNPYCAIPAEIALATARPAMRGMRGRPRGEE